MWNHYIGKDRSNVSLYAAPARAEDLAGLPPAYMMTCEHDPLRDEAIIYAMRLNGGRRPGRIAQLSGHRPRFRLPDAIRDLDACGQ